jgi:hypothetical protein
MGPPPVETPHPVHVNTIAYWVFATTVTGLLKVTDNNPDGRADELTTELASAAPVGLPDPSAALIDTVIKVGGA